MDPIAIVTAAGGAGQQPPPPPEPVSMQAPDTAAALPQHAASAQQAAALPNQGPPRPVEDSGQAAGKNGRQDPGRSQARNRAEGKGQRLDLQA